MAIIKNTARTNSMIALLLVVLKLDSSMCDASSIIASRILEAGVLCFVSCFDILLTLSLQL